jgi:protein-S-isoprenylcysteine O-methyltransferase Ste14
MRHVSSGGLMATLSVCPGVWKGASWHGGRISGARQRTEADERLLKYSFAVFYDACRGPAAENGLPNPLQGYEGYLLMNRSIVGRNAFAGLVGLVGFIAMVLVLSAGSLRFWLGWIFLLNFAICVTAITVYLLIRDPALAERRMRGGGGPMAEPEMVQKIIRFAVSLIFLLYFVIPGLDFRFGWSTVPLAVVTAGHVLTVLAFVGILVVFRANSFAGSTVEVAADQRVIDTGPYAVVRHPMYAAALFLFVGIPLALGSTWALLLAVPMIAALVARVLNEERYLDANLAGYTSYRRRVRWRLMPLVW